METDQIDGLLFATIPNYLGTFAMDQIPVTQLRPAYMVINTHPANRRGQHWIAMVLGHNDVIEYFDSFGMLPPRGGIRSYLNENSREWLFSDKTLQHPQSVSCGPFCCVFLYLRSRRCTFREFLNQFGDDLEANEDTVHKLFTSLKCRADTV